MIGTYSLLPISLLEQHVEQIMSFWDLPRLLDDYTSYIIFMTSSKVDVDNSDRASFK